MMKEKIRIRKYNYNSSNIDIIVSLHKSISKGTPFENNLVYYDSNFVNYLHHIIDSPFHYFYVVEINDKIVGIIHIRFIKDFLFLNNIALNEKFKARGLGKKLLTFALNDLGTIYDLDTVLKLDVFTSNSIALNWYHNLGLKEESRKEWFNFKKNVLSTPTSTTFIKHMDDNGFIGLYDNETKIGTSILDNLILHNSNKITDIDFSNYNTILSDDCGFITLNNLNEFKIKAKTIDISIRMKNTVRDILSIISI